MNNKYLMASFMGVLTFLATYLLLVRDEKTADKKFEKVLEKAGIPDQMEGNDLQAENADMVSEGSQFGVQYYNDLPESVKEEIKDK